MSEVTSEPFSESSSSLEVVEDSGPPVATELVSLRWPWGCKHVTMIAGSWAEWTPQVMFPVKEAGNPVEVWTVRFQLPTDASYRYKFIVDGDWMHDMTLPAKRSVFGGWENVLKLGNAPEEDEDNVLPMSMVAHFVVLV